MQSLRNHIAVWIVFTALLSCGGKAEPIIPERKAIEPSPTKVVEEFLKAIKDEKFEKAFQYVYAPYSDKEGYVIQMRNTVKDNQLTILGYRILGTQIFDRTSIVVVELNQKLKSPTTGQIVELTQNSQYDLGLFDDKWKITSGNCIKNCLEMPQREPSQQAPVQQQAPQQQAPTQKEQPAS
jgi:hypothetical protein